MEGRGSVGGKAIHNENFVVGEKKLSTSNGFGRSRPKTGLCVYLLIRVSLYIYSAKSHQNSFLQYHHIIINIIITLLLDHHSITLKACDSSHLRLYISTVLLFLSCSSHNKSTSPSISAPSQVLLLLLLLFQKKQPCLPQEEEEVVGIK